MKNFDVLGSIVFNDNCSEDFTWLTEEMNKHGYAVSLDPSYRDTTYYILKETNRVVAGKIKESET